jgi:mannobiose 2-epimerase
MKQSILFSYQNRIRAELLTNILPFWMERALDHHNGGYYGALTNDLVVDNDVPRSAVVAARILWTFSAAYRAFPDMAYLAAARHAFNYLTGPLWDGEFDGVYWTADRHGQAVNDRKHVYAQAFAIYALSEYYQACGEPRALSLAQKLFGLIETHSFDALHGGNIECLNRAWGQLEDMRLSDKEPQARKSMNTLLHLMEAYTNLLRIWPDPQLKAKQAGLISVFLDYIIDLPSGHFRLYFDDAWHPFPSEASYGHDIEGAWLMVEAAEVQGDPHLLERARAAGLRMAEAVYAEGRDVDGSIFYEAGPENPVATQKHWWGQAEGMVGFYCTYQDSGHEALAAAALQCWDYIEAHFIDRIHGDWFKVLDRTGGPLPGQLKVGPWECPYHHARACLEMDRRIKLFLPKFSIFLH